MQNESRLYGSSLGRGSGSRICPSACSVAQTAAGARTWLRVRQGDCRDATRCAWRSARAQPREGAWCCCRSQATRRHVPWLREAWFYWRVVSSGYVSVIYWASERLFKHCTELKKKNCYAWFYCFFMKYSCWISIFSIFTVPQPFIITALWSHDCSPVSSIKKPSEESSWNFPSMHGISASQFSLIFVTLRVGIPRAVFWKCCFREEKSGEGNFASKQVYFFSVLSE